MFVGVSAIGGGLFQLDRSFDVVSVTEFYYSGSTRGVTEKGMGQGVC